MLQIVFKKIFSLLFYCIKCSVVLGYKEGGEEIQLSDEAQDREQQEQQRGDEEWRVLRAD